MINFVERHVYLNTTLTQRSQYFPKVDKVTPISIILTGPFKHSCLVYDLPENLSGLELLPILLMDVNHDETIKRCEITQLVGNRSSPSWLVYD